MENQDEERKPTPLLRRLLHKTVLCEPVRGDWGFGPALSVLVPLWCGIRGKGHSLTPISTLKKYERGEPYYSLIGVPVVREGEPHICCSFLSVSAHAVSGRVQQSRVKRAPTSWSESLRKHQETRKHQGDDGQSGTLETDVISCL